MKKQKKLKLSRVEQNQHDVDTDEEIGHADEEKDQTAQNSSIHDGNCYQQENSQVQPQDSVELQPQDSVELQDARTGIHRESHEGDSLNQRGN